MLACLLACTQQWGVVLLAPVVVAMATTKPKYLSPYCWSRSWPIDSVLPPIDWIYKLPPTSRSLQEKGTIMIFVQRERNSMGRVNSRRPAVCFGADLGHHRHWQRADRASVLVNGGSFYFPFLDPCQQCMTMSCVADHCPPPPRKKPRNTLRMPQKSRRPNIEWYSHVNHLAI